MAAPGPGPSFLSPPSPKMAGAIGAAMQALHPHIVVMRDSERSERQQRLDATITEALQQEAARHEAAVKNMHRLRALRLERDQKMPAVKREAQEDWGH